MGFLAEFWSYLKARKKFWLVPAGTSLTACEASFENTCVVAVKTFVP